jgi:hypothetical protein
LSTLREAGIPCTSIDEQAVVATVVLLNELGELVRLLCVVERIQVHDLVPRPFGVSDCLRNARRNSLGLILVGFHLRSHSKVESLASRLLHCGHEVLRVVLFVVILDLHGFVRGHANNGSTSFIEAA